MKGHVFDCFFGPDLNMGPSIPSSHVSGSTTWPKLLPIKVSSVISVYREEGKQVWVSSWESLEISAHLSTYRTFSPFERTTPNRIQLPNRLRDQSLWVISNLLHKAQIRLLPF